MVDTGAAQFGTGPEHAKAVQTYIDRHNRIWLFTGGPHGGIQANIEQTGGAFGTTSRLGFKTIMAARDGV
jgi:hypothetical protein